MTSDNTVQDLPTEPDDEQLVAYLDGELTGSQRESLEQRLLDDDTLRMRLQQLQSGWDWLDEMPKPHTDEKMVESTLEIVVADVLKQVPANTTTTTSAVGRLPMIILIGSLLAGAVGFIGVNQRRQMALANQLDDLAIVQNLDAYLYAKDQKLIRELLATPSWTNMVRRLEELDGRAIEPVKSVSLESSSSAEREQQIQELPIEKRAALESRWDQFQRYRPEERDEIRKTAESVKNQVDAEALLTAMTVYARWREQYLTAELRDQVQSKDPKTRRLGIEAAVSHTLMQVSRGAGRFLKEETAAKIYQKLDAFLDERIFANPELTPRVDKSRNPFSEYTRIRLVYQMLRIPNPGKNTPMIFRMPPRPGQQPPPLSDLEWEELTDVLDDQAQDDLSLLSSWSPIHGPDQVLAQLTLSAWAEEAVFRELASMTRKPQSAFERYRELSNEQRDRYDLMPPEEFTERVSRGSRGGMGRKPPRPPSSK